MKKLFLAFLVVFVAVAVYYYFPEGKIADGKTADKLIVYREDHRLEVYAGDELLKTYPVSLVKKKENPDEFDEDRSVPEGTYFVFDKDSRSQYHKSIGFAPEPYTPDAADADDSKKKKKKKAGFRIHGMKRGYGFIGKFHRWTDWTKGGIAITDEEIDDIFAHIEPGASVVVR